MSKKTLWSIISGLVACLVVTVVLLVIDSFENDDKKGSEDKKDDKSQVANPASAYCEERGGELEIRTGGDENQTGYCLFEDGSECEEWSFYRGECEKGDSLLTEGVSYYNDELVLIEPEEQEEIVSPLTVKGRVLGSWFFEGSFPFSIVGEFGEDLGTGFVTAQGDWMTDEYVDFMGDLVFDSTGHEAGFLVLENDNPSGLEENSKKVSIPIKFKKSFNTEEKMTVKVFFNNTVKDPQLLDCSSVYGVDREIEKTVAVGRASLEELLKGPTSGEESDGYITNLNTDVVIQSLTVEGGVAYVDFDERLQNQVGGSCKVTAIRAQIEETLKQFSTVDSVVISIDGETENILQP